MRRTDGSLKIYLLYPWVKIRSYHMDRADGPAKSHYLFWVKALIINYPNCLVKCGDLLVCNL